MKNLWLERNGEIYRALVQEDAGCWLISYNSPAAPFFVSDLGEYQRTTPPPLPEGQLSEAAQKRAAIIAPLMVAGDAAITDKAARCKLAHLIAAANDTTPRRVLRLYYRYIATGQLLSPKAHSPTPNPDFDWAIRKFYYSAKRLSLRGTYEMLLLQRFCDHQGQLAPLYPSFASFRSYFYSRSFHKSPQKIIARQGLSHYQRNCQPAFGCASEWRKQPGSYQMDATEADIYLLSDNGTPFRPYIYLAVDTATQLVAGVWAGAECDESAVMRCLGNCVQDKVEWCGRYGITITEEQWPSAGLPLEIITDKGREFCGSRMDELCRRYGVELIAQAPFRPDRKGLVEQAFHLLQERFKPLLRGKGVIEPDAQERWAVDYREQAILTLEDFTQVLIHCILYLNSGRTLSSGHTPAQLWAESTPQLLHVAPEELRLMSLPRTTAKLSRKGLRANGVWYVPADMERMYLGDTLTLAYDPSNLSATYLVDYQWRVCEAAPGQGVGRGGLLSQQPNIGGGGLPFRQPNAGELPRQRLKQETREAAIRAGIECVAAIQGVIERSGRK